MDQQQTTSEALEQSHDVQVSSESGVQPVLVSTASVTTEETKNDDSSSPNKTNNTTPSAEDRRATFRKRRLSLPMHHLSTSDDEEDEKDGDTPNHHHHHHHDNNEPQHDSTDEKAHTFRKRRLSLTTQTNNHHPSPTTTTPAAKRPRRASEYSSDGSSSCHNNHTRTLHASELLEGPPSPVVHGDVYDRSPPPIVLPAPVLNNQVPVWHKRRTLELGNKLPFRPEIVGTYSCHGMEPVYDSTYEEEEEEEEDAVDDTQQTTATTAAKINQDRGGIAYPFGNSPRTALFAVYDGHGQGGELVSQFALHELPRRLERHAHFRDDLPTALKETFLQIDDALKEEPLIEPLVAGTTACVALVSGRTVTTANAGDSRAVLARRTALQEYTAVDLTMDQNPDTPAERQRIEAAGGHITPSPGPGLSARVWLDADCTQIGLAMARSIGDHAVSTVGVIAEPVVVSYELMPEDEFMVLASDGVWEFLESQDAVRIVAEHLHRGATKACQALIEAAAARWHEEEGEYRDDITAIVVQLKHLWDFEKE